VEPTPTFKHSVIDTDEEPLPLPKGRPSIVPPLILNKTITHSFDDFVKPKIDQRRQSATITQTKPLDFQREHTMIKADKMIRLKSTQGTNIKRTKFSETMTVGLKSKVSFLKATDCEKYKLQQQIIEYRSQINQSHKRISASKQKQIVFMTQIEKMLQDDLIRTQKMSLL
jgi:hypothetical protein